MPIGAGAGAGAGAAGGLLLIIMALIGFRGGGTCWENNRLASFIPERSHFQSSTLSCQPIEVPTTWLPGCQHRQGTAGSATPDNTLEMHGLSPPRNPIRATIQCSAPPRRS